MMRLERQQGALMTRHSQEIADMISTMKHFSATTVAWDGNLVSSLAQVENIEVGPERG